MFHGLAIQGAENLSPTSNHRSKVGKFERVATFQHLLPYKLRNNMSHSSGKKRDSREGRVYLANYLSQPIPSAADMLEEHFGIMSPERRRRAERRKSREKTILTERTQYDRREETRPTEHTQYVRREETRPTEKHSSDCLGTCQKCGKCRRKHYTKYVEERDEVTVKKNVSSGEVEEERRTVRIESCSCRRKEHGKMTSSMSIGASSHCHRHHK